MNDTEPFTFIAPDGTYWAVHEIRNSTEPDATTSLIFAGDHGFRRVRVFPTDWRELDVDELWALSWRM